MLPTSIPFRSLTGEPQLGAGVALAGVRDVGDVVRRVVAGHVHVPACQPTRLAPATRFGERGDQLVDDDDGVAGTDGRAIARPPCRAP